MTTIDYSNHQSSKILQSIWQSYWSPSSPPPQATQTRNFSSSGTTGVNPNSVVQQPQQPQQQTATYIFLVEFSQCLKLRCCYRKLDGNDNDDNLYRRAGLQTPFEMATRDWLAGNLWLQYLTQSLLETPVRHSNGDNLQLQLQQQQQRVIWFQTLPCHRNKGRSKWFTNMQTKHGKRFVVLDCCGSDPWGWDCDNTVGGDSILGSLDKIREIIQTHCKSIHSVSSIAVVFDSITPLKLRYGVDPTIHFLKQISLEIQPAILVIPIVVETYEYMHLYRLEDLSQAVLYLADGEAELLRHGVRERGNRVREHLPYRIIPVDPDLGNSMIELKSSDDIVSFKQDIPEDKAHGSLHNNTPIPLHSELVPSTKRATSMTKIQLHADEGGRRAMTETTVQQPQIFMQDDDPEFEDFDEEDPDDDLEI